MSLMRDPFEVVVVEDEATTFDALSRKPLATSSASAALPGAVTARFHGFDLSDQPLVVGVPDLPHEIVAARATIPLLRSQIGSTVVLVFEQGDPRRPIVIGMLEPPLSQRDAVPTVPLVAVQADADRFIVSAEREIVLRCGDASITLTRAGKVIIKGAYIVSRSSGYNKIKGAAVDIN